MPYGQTLCVVIYSDIETARLHCAELVDCLVKQGYNKRRTDKQVECAFTNFANHSLAHKSHTTQTLYFGVQFLPGLPDIKGILLKKMTFWHQSVTMKTCT